jgi:hypothetical protein
MAPDIVIRPYLDRCQEYGIETVLCAIEKLRHAKFWHGKDIGMHTLLEERKFAKLIDGEYDNEFAKPGAKEKLDKSKGIAPLVDLPRYND